MSNKKTVIKSDEITITKSIKCEITNDKAISFFNKYKTIKPEEIIYWSIEMINNIISSEKNISSSIASQIFDSINKQNTDFTNLLNNIITTSNAQHSDIKHINQNINLINQNINNQIDSIKTQLNFINQKLIDQLNLSKNEYINELKKSISENESHSAIINKIDMQNLVLFDKINTLIHDFFPKNQINTIDTLLLNFKNDFLKLSNEVKSDNVNFTFEKISNILNEKYNFLINSIQSQMQENLIKSEQIFNNNIDNLKTITNDITSFTKKNIKSSTKGDINETMLSNILEGLFGIKSIINTCKIPHSGDFIIRRENHNDIIVENKAYVNMVGFDEVNKFVYDIETNPNTNGIFISQFSQISKKKNFQIDFHNDAILIYIDCCEYNADKISLAVDIIDSLSKKLSFFKNNNISISQEVLTKINNEYKLFIENRIQILNHYRDFSKKHIENINNLQLPSIDNLISLHFSNNKNTLIQCPHCCVKSFASKLSLARHIDKCDKVPENIKKKDKKTKSIEL